VRRATYWDPELKADDPAKAGICSNFLCDAKPGQEITLTGEGGWDGGGGGWCGRCPTSGVPGVQHLAACS